MTEIIWNRDVVIEELAEVHRMHHNVPFIEALGVAEDIMIYDEMDMYDENIDDELENNHNYTGYFLVTHNGATKRLMVENSDDFLEVIDNQNYDDDFAVWFDNDKIDVVVDRGIKKDLYTLVPVKL